MLAAYSTLLNKYLPLPLFYPLRHCYSPHLLPSAEGIEGLGIRAIIAHEKKKIYQLWQTANTACILISKAS